MRERLDGYDQTPATVRVYDRASGTLVPKPVVSSKFLMGPIPVDWLIAAERLRGRALVVGLCLWRIRWATKSLSVRLFRSELAPWGVDRSTKSRALQALQEAGLVRIEQEPGKLGWITILGARDGTPL
jgi:hypothetical protein